MCHQSCSSRPLPPPNPEMSLHQCASIAVCRYGHVFHLPPPRRWAANTDGWAASTLVFFWSHGARVAAAFAVGLSFWRSDAIASVAQQRPPSCHEHRSRCVFPFFFCHSMPKLRPCPVCFKVQRYQSIFIPAAQGRTARCFCDIGSKRPPPRKKSTLTASLACSQSTMK